VFSLPLAGTNRVRIILRNFPDDGGIDYVLDPGAGSKSIPLAAMDGHFRGPALAWPELIAASLQPDPDHTPAERLLLLLPACADRDRPDTAVDTVAAALTAVGAESDIHRVAGELLNSPGNGSRDCAWIAVDGALVCLGTHAYRGGQLTPSDLRLVTEAFRHTPAGP
jgi:hypothetical protein